MPTNLLRADEAIFHLAFENSAQPNIISIISSGKIIVANRAACHLLGYSCKEFLTKNRSDIFDIKEDTIIPAILFIFCFFFYTKL